MLSQRSLVTPAFMQIFLAACVTLFAEPVQAQDAVSLGEAIASGDSVLIWDALLECDIVFDSRSGKPGTFEVSMRELDSRKFKRVQVAMHNGKLTFALSNQLAIPLGVGDLNGRYTLNSGGTWAYCEAPWEVRLDGQRLNVFDLREVPPTSTAELNIAATLQLLSKGERTPFQWDRSNLTLDTELPEGQRISIRLHSPNDQVRFGTPIAGIYYVPHDKKTLTKIEAMSFREEDVP